MNAPCSRSIVVEDLTPISRVIAEEVAKYLAAYNEGAITSPELLLRVACDITNWLPEVEAENAAVVADGERRFTERYGF